MSNEMKLIPELRFPEFINDGEWVGDTLINIAKFRRGSFPQPYGLPEWYDNENGMPFIQVYDVGDDFRLKPTTKSKISKLAAKQSVFIKKGTVIITIQGSIGRVAITQYDAYIDRTLLLFEEFYNEIDKTFFAYILFLLFEIEKQKAPGGIIKTITKEVLSDFVVSFPQPKEQQKIASCLSSLDELIAAHNDKLEALNDHKKGLMQNLFPQEGQKEPNYRFPEFEKDGEWVETKLGEVCNMQAGKFVRASEIKENLTDGLFPCYGGNGLRGYTKSYTHSGKYSLIGRQGALCGNVNLVDGTFHATEHAVVVTPEEGADTDWLYYVLILLNLNQFATGQAQPGLSVSNIEMVELKIPLNPKEQQKIASCLSALDELINAQAEIIEQLQQHKKGLMQGLFPKLND
jgi:type I restriction enzyme S subunit